MILAGQEHGREEAHASELGNHKGYALRHLI